MLARTHFVISILFFLLIFNFISEKWIFATFFFLATFFVDIDSKKSLFGNFLFFRPLQIFISHRGIFHTFLVCFILSVLISIFSVSGAVGFFLGYLLHLVLDCFTVQGVKIFFPFCSRKLKGKVRSGGLVEEILFVLILLLDLFLVGKMFFEMLF